jgi:1,4-dihydroxy-2-naphthoate octaprenyltransferase
LGIAEGEMDDMTGQYHSVSLSAWIRAVRLPFTTVALVPFGVGVFLASANHQSISWPASLTGTLAVFCMCVGCYLIGEVYDQAEDRQTMVVGRTRFSGGTLTVVNGMVTPKAALVAACFCFALAALLGLYIFSIRQTLWLLGLGTFGGASAFLYSFPPVRLVKRGVGELFIGICYGWLTMVTGYACASGAMPPDSYLFCWPVALSIFNVILINEFPDFNPDRASGKCNLLVRIGRERGAQIYAAASLITAVALLGLWYRYHGLAFTYLLLTVPGIILALVLAYLVVCARAWTSLQKIEPVCALTIVLNHVTSLTIGALVRW